MNYSLSNFLMFCFYGFVYMQSGRFGKLNKRVAFPETLNLSPYMSEAGDGSDIYKLYAVVVHIDMLNASFFGHYICYIKDFLGQWYRIDDSKVYFCLSTKLLSIFLFGRYIHFSLNFQYPHLCCITFLRLLVWNWRRYFLREHTCCCIEGILHSFH
jgi:hypothetical protein